MANGEHLIVLAELLKACAMTIRKTTRNRQQEDVARLVESGHAAPAHQERKLVTTETMPAAKQEEVTA